MSTNSTIAVVHANGTVSQIYVHWDGHIDTAGKCLVKNYTTLSKVEQLVALGNLSCLEARTAPSIDEKHDFNNSAAGVCVAYARDRGEEDQQAEQFDSLQHLAGEARQEEYDYLFVNGQWFVQDQSRYRYCASTVDAALAAMGMSM